MIRDNNYISIPGWAVTKLGLKGNDLLVYSIIYGFSQTPGTYFSGSINYLAEWTNSSPQGVHKNLNNLLDKGVIIKYEGTPTNKYVAIIPDSCLTKSVESVVEEEEEFKEKVKSDRVNTDKYKEQVALDETVSDIIAKLNSTCGTKFKATTSSTKKVIKARLKEGFVKDDFTKVIERKYDDWGKNPIKFSNGQWSNEYLRPQTLFGDKFESYLHEANTKNTLQATKSYGNSQSVPVSNNLSDKVY